MKREESTVREGDYIRLVDASRQIPLIAGRSRARSMEAFIDWFAANGACMMGNSCSSTLRKCAVCMRREISSGEQFEKIPASLLIHEGMGQMTPVGK